MRSRALLSTAAALACLAPAPSAQSPPPVRTCAEWEPAVGTMIRYPFGIPDALVTALAADEKVWILVVPQQLIDAERKLDKLGVPVSQVEYIPCPVDSIWPRDYGPHQLFDGNGTWTMLDYIYIDTPMFQAADGCGTSNWFYWGSYPGDDACTADIAAHFAAPMEFLPGALTGGNFLVDGQGHAFSTCSLTDENAQWWTAPQYHDLVRQFTGTDDYHIFEPTEPNGIQHIDCWMKPLDEERLLVKRVEPGHYEYAAIEANLALLQGMTNCYGEPYQIERIDCPPYYQDHPAAYTNSLILNDTIYVPFFNIPGDAIAKQTFEELMPGYEVQGFYHPGFNSGDALHCRTRAVFDRHMLLLQHERLTGIQPIHPGYPLEVRIIDYSQAGLIASQLKVLWRLEGELGWKEAALTATGAPDMFGGAIPAQLPGALVEYYLAAADHSGRVETMPRVAPEGFYTFQVDPLSLSADVATLSLSAGGTQSFSLSAGWPSAGLLYLLLGSASGARPGLDIDGWNLPLNPDDYFLLTLGSPNSPVHPNSLGTLDPGGQASSAFVLPPGQSGALAGLKLFHAYAVIDDQSVPGNPFVSFASSAVAVALTP